MILLSINNFLMHLFNICNPYKKNIYVFIDGCTSINKINT